MEVRLVQCKTATSPSRLPGLDRALNPYRGCGHACSYCYAQDVTRFEMSRQWGEVVEVKANIVECLKKELAKGLKGMYGIGTVTDPYQPLEKQYELTRGCLKLLRNANAKVSVLTKSDLILRDLDMLRGWENAEVGLSIGCIDEKISSIVEPGAPSPSHRFEAAARLVHEGVDTYIMAAPVLPDVCDSEQTLKDLVAATAEAGVRRIMWDGFNPKPLATKRLRDALEDAGIGRRYPQILDGAKWIRSILLEESSRKGIALSDAF